MIRKIIIPNDSPITIYDCTKQSVVGIFATKTLTSRYLFHDHSNKFMMRVRDSINFKRKIKDSVLGIPVALRHSNEKQIELLNGQEFVISEGYYTPRHTLMKGFTDTAKTLHDDHCGKYRAPASKKSNEI